jgi:hypothetical protein
MENYKNKYLKYKNKYLILKSKITNMIGGLTDEEKRNLIEQNYSSQGTKKRIFAEIKKLEEKGYDVDLSQIDSKKIIVSDANNNRLYVEINDGYPFKPIKVFLVNQQVNPGITIEKYISELPKSSNTNVLVYCHPYKYDSSENKHFLSDVIEQVILESRLSEPSIYTLDIQREPNILADGFSEDFLGYFSNSNPTFDLVFMFDCSGPWSHYQGFNKENLEDKDKIIELINNVLRIVKSGGKLIISKILSVELYNLILTSIPNSIPFISEHLLDRSIVITK